MQITATQMGTTALRAAMESFKQAERLMLRAVDAVGDGDIIDAALSVNQAKVTAKSGAAVARAAIEVSETLLDVLA